MYDVTHNLYFIGHKLELGTRRFHHYRVNLYTAWGGSYDNSHQPDPVRLREDSDLLKSDLEGFYCTWKRATVTWRHDG